MLVLGAGCSREDPTNLPLAGDLSQKCHQQLLLNGVLQPGEVSDHHDLSKVADAVFKNTGGQEELISCFPPEVFRTAPANSGYKIMAALLLEGALSDAMTLNFDLAAHHALIDLRITTEVSEVRGPEYHGQLGNQNIIYLHRDINCNPNDLILRSDALDAAWEDRWEQIVAHRVLTSPVVVFVGLGSSASLLIKTTQRIASAKGGSLEGVYVVDPTDYASSDFAEALNLPYENYVRMGWGDFMDRLSRRLVEEHRSAITEDCELLVAQRSNTASAIASEDVSDICEQLTEGGILRLGEIRARWTLRNTSYQPLGDSAALHRFCDLILGVRMLERLSESKARLYVDGTVEFSLDRLSKEVIVCSGEGWMTMAQLDAEVSKRCEDLRSKGREPSFALVSAFVGSSELAPPQTITMGEEPNDLITRSRRFEFIDLESLRLDPHVVNEVFR